MAPPTVASTTKVEHVAPEAKVAERHAQAQVRAASGHGEGQAHSEGEEKAGAPAKPVLVEEPGVTGSSKLDGKGLRVSIVASRWLGKEVIHALVEACSEELLDKGVAEKDLSLVEVAGAFELPFAAAQLVKARPQPDVVICIGCMVKDATSTSEVVGHAVASGLMKLNVESDVPVVCGVLNCDSEQQARACTTQQVSQGSGGGKKCNYGVLWAQSALEMAQLKRCVAGKLGFHCCTQHCPMEHCHDPACAYRCGHCSGHHGHCGYWVHNHCGGPCGGRCGEKSEASGASGQSAGTYTCCCPPGQCKCVSCTCTCAPGNCKCAHCVCKASALAKESKEEAEMMTTVETTKPAASQSKA